MRIALVVAFDRKFAIGVDGQLPWQLPDDLKHFKSLTLGKPILMGRLTAESLGRALPGRQNLVLTRSGRVPFDCMEAVDTVDAALERARATGADELAVIGGGGVFAATLPIATHLHLTEVAVSLDRADAYFPPLDRSQWLETSRVHHAADARHALAFDFVDLQRVS